MATSRNLLLVEDELLIAMNEARMLRKEGYGVELAASGEEAIARVEARPGEIDLILMDINLGSGLDGTQAALEILKNHDIPIVFLSSHTEPEVVAKTEKITSYGYVVKDSNITVLNASIKMAFKLHAAHQALRKTNEKLSLAQESSRAGTWDWDIAQNNFDWSSEFLKLFGMSEDTIMGFDSWSKVIHPEDRSMAAQRIQESIDQRTDLLNDYRIILPNQEIRWIRATGKTYYNDTQPTRMIGLCIDITERKQVEEALRESEGKYRALIAEMFTGFALNQIQYDAIGNPIDYITIEVNKAFEAYLNTTREAVIGIKASDILPPEELNYWLGIFGPVVQTGVPAHYEMYSPLNQKYFEGSAFSSGKDQFAVTFTDITEWKQAEESSRKSQSELAELLEHTPDMIARFDRNYRHVYVNSAVTKETGRPVSVLIGKSHRELGTMPLKQVEFSENIIRQVFESGQEVSFETFILTDQGTKYYLSLGVPEFGADETVTNALFIHRNITEQKQTESALRENQVMLRQILDTLPQGVFWKDKNGVYLGCNQVFARACGLSNSDEVIGKTDFDLPWLKAEAEAYRADDAQVVDTRVPKRNLIEPLQQSDGTRLWISTSKMPLLDAQQEVRGVLGIYEDITARKQTDEELRTNRMRFQAMIDAAPIPYALNDDQHNIRYVNTAFRRAIGYDLTDIPTLTEWWQLAYPDPAYRDWVSTTWQTRLEKSKHTGMSFDPMEVDIHCKNGDVRTFTVSAATLPDQFTDVHAVIFFDITERKRTEQALLSRNEAFTGYFNMGTVGMCVTSPEKGWVEVNEHLCRMLGYTKEELVQLTWADLTHPEDLQNDVAMFNQVMTGERDSYVLDKRFIRKDGQVVYTTLYVTCQRKPDGTVRHFLASLVDITARKQMEETLQRSIEEKEALMHELQHRIKNSLTVASSLLAMEEGNLPDAHTRSVFASAQARLNSMAAIYEQLYHGGGVDRIDLRQYIQRLVAGLTQSYLPEERKVRIETDLHQVHIDLKRALPLGMILNELITNAIKYAYPPGSTTPDEPGVITVRLVKTEREIQVVVADQGIGMPDTNPHSGGMGLELVRILTQQINGKFDIHFENGCIACITFILE